MSEDQILMSEQCVCGKAKLFDQCCGVFLSGKQHAKTPEQLMRSRYCAYAKGGYGDYLYETWHPAIRHSLTPTSLSEVSVSWNKLEILEKSQKGNQGFVEFNAFYMDDQGKEKVLHERSSFQRIAGKWFYVGGEIE